MRSETIPRFGGCQGCRDYRRWIIIPRHAQQKTLQGARKLISARPVRQPVACAPIAVIVPAYQAGAHIGACLEGLFSAGFCLEEIVVVDDGSSDGTGEVAKAAGIRTLRNPVARGPARARNRGVVETDAEIVVFIDSDVVVHSGARERLVEHFTSDQPLSAVFGSYDDSPAAQRPVSRYRNLLHHYVHQNALREANTFWTGFGAVRRDAFLAIGGLDPAWENIEDVEFGMRLAGAGGRILLDREMLATHLKDWTVLSMLQTDLLGRAVPWTRLLFFHGAAIGDLNTAAQHRTAAVAVMLVVTASIVSLFDHRALFVVGAGVLLFLAASHRFLGFLFIRHGTAFAMRSIPWHAMHYGASVSGYVWVVLTEAIPSWLGIARGRRRKPYKKYLSSSGSDLTS